MSSSKQLNYINLVRSVRSAMASDKSDPRFQQLVMSAIQSGENWEQQLHGDRQMEKLGVILRRFVSIENVIEFDTKKKADSSIAGAALGKGAAVEKKGKGDKGDKGDKDAQRKKPTQPCLICEVKPDQPNAHFTGNCKDVGKLKPFAEGFDRLLPADTKAKLARHLIKNTLFLKHYPGGAKAFQAVVDEARKPARKDPNAAVDK